MDVADSGQDLGRQNRADAAQLDQRAASLSNRCGDVAVPGRDAPVEVADLGDEIDRRRRVRAPVARGRSPRSNVAALSTVSRACTPPCTS
jgi:hypothetical protein